MNLVKEWIKKLIPWKEREKKIYSIYKKSRFFYIHGMKEISNYYSDKIYKKYNCYIHGSAEIGENLRIPHPIGVVIGDGVKIGKNVVLYQNVTLGRKHRDIPEYPTVDDDTIIYSNSVIAGKIHIGKRCVIGCNSTVLKDIEDGTRVSGVVK